MLFGLIAKNRFEVKKKYMNTVACFVVHVPFIIVEVKIAFVCRTGTENWHLWSWFGMLPWEVTAVEHIFVNGS